MKRTILLLAALAASCGGSSEHAQPAATPVQVSEVLSTGDATGMRYSAAIKPDQQVDLAFRVGGYIEQIRTVRGADGRLRPIGEGDRIERGVVLARVRQADYNDKVVQGSAVVDEARAGFDQAKRDFDRAAALFQTQSITRPEYEGAKARLDAADARLRNAQAGSRDAHLAMGDANLTAPISGMILKRNIDLGSLVGPGSAAFTIADTRNVKVVFGVPDVLVQSIKPGEKLSVATEAIRGRHFAGAVTRVAPSADSKSRVFEIEVSIPNPDDALKVGMVAALEMGGKGVAAPHVPIDAIIRTPQHPDDFSVFVVDGAAARNRPVKLGETSGNSVEVIDGLREGDRVVVRGASMLSDGETVRVVP